METKLTKNEKGITLVALIITIIILLILAVISIRAITGDDILGKAETAKEKYESAKTNELDILNDYSNGIENDSKARYYLSDQDENGYTYVFKIDNGILMNYARKEEGLYKIINVPEEYMQYEIDVKTKIKVDGKVYHFDKALAVKLTDQKDYKENDIVIENVHYSQTGIALMSDQEIAVYVQNKFYFEDIDESEMTDLPRNDIGIYNRVNNFDESLLSDEPFQG